ncbi:MAG: CapA family protein [Actinomycetaceae bacterium]|nr:CapA family protein [Actinomycetaceae bacterium]
MKRSRIPAGIALLAAFALAACSPAVDAQPEITEAPTPAPTPAPTEPPTPPVTFTVVGTGDVLSHMPVVEHSIQADGSYDYAPLVADIKPFIEGADLALCHQEVPLTSDEASAHGYPVFAAPAGWADSTVALGYDGCSTASNHSWDRGEFGLMETVEILQAKGLGAVGTSVSAEQSPIQYYELDREGRTIRVAHLSFTYGLNYEYVPEVEENPWLVNVNNPDYMVELARQARDEGANVVIVSAHGGIEYQPEPSDQQREWARIFADSGVVDLYIGHHVHVPQPLEHFEGGVDGSGMWAFFGTGNLVSNMGPDMGIDTQNGYIASATITVPKEGPAHVDSVGYTGLVLDTDTNRVYVAATYDQADHPGAYLSNDARTYYYDYLKEVMGGAPEILEAPATPAPPVRVIPRD